MAIRYHWKIRYGFIVALPLMAALCVSILVAAFGICGADARDISAGSAAVIAAPAADKDAPAGTAAPRRASSLSADNILQITWFSLSFIGQAICAGVSEEISTRFGSGLPAYVPSSAGAAGRQLSGPAFPGSVNGSVARQILSLRISQIKAG